MLSGTLAVSRVSSVRPPTPSRAACANSAAGADYDQLASILMPSPTTQSRQAAQSLPPEVFAARALKATGPMEPRYTYPVLCNEAGNGGSAGVAPGSGSSPTALLALNTRSLPSVSTQVRRRTYLTRGHWPPSPDWPISAC